MPRYQVESKKRGKVGDSWWSEKNVSQARLVLQDRWVTACWCCSSTWSDEDTWRYKPVVRFGKFVTSLKDLVWFKVEETLFNPDMSKMWHVCKNSLFIYIHQAFPITSLRINKNVIFKLTLLWTKVAFIPRPGVKWPNDYRLFRDGEFFCLLWIILGIHTIEMNHFSSVLFVASLILFTFLGSQLVSASAETTLPGAQ